MWFPSEVYNGSHVFAFKILTIATFCDFGSKDGQLICKTSITYFSVLQSVFLDTRRQLCPQSMGGIMKWFPFSFHSRRIINLGPVMLISEEQPAQPALPIQPEGTRVVCGHCGNTFLVSKQIFVMVTSVCKCTS